MRSSKELALRADELRSDLKNSASASRDECKKRLAVLRDGAGMPDEIGGLYTINCKNKSLRFSYCVRKGTELVNVSSETDSYLCRFWMVEDIKLWTEYTYEGK